MKTILVNNLRQNSEAYKIQSPVNANLTLSDFFFGQSRYLHLPEITNTLK